jgi:hypothetical protein
MGRFPNVFTACALAVATLSAGTASAQTVTATYLFGSTFEAVQSGVPALVPIDPQATSTFETDTVFGQSRTVYHFIGTTVPAQQSGLTLNTTGLVTPNNYSVELVTELADRPNAYRRLLDVQNRASDSGFYVNPSNNLEVYPVSGGTGAFTTGIYHHIVLTDANSNTVNAYLDGALSFTASTSIMHLNSDLVNNPNELLGFFLDNTAGGGQGEYSTGKIALARLYDGVLTGSQVATLSSNPFGSTAASTPEPGVVGLLMGMGLSGSIFVLRRRRK